MAKLGSESIVVVRAAGVDRFGDPVAGAAVPTTILDCAVIPRISSEQNDRGVVLIDGLEVWAPAGSDIKATDEIQARGKTWGVEGTPGEYRNRRGKGKGLRVFLRKVG